MFSAAPTADVQCARRSRRVKTFSGNERRAGVPGKAIASCAPATPVLVATTTIFFFFPVLQSGRVYYYFYVYDVVVVVRVRPLSLMKKPVSTL